ncbi:hypothetical protein JCM19992_20480 [Thermostilla marina]
MTRLFANRFYRCLFSGVVLLYLAGTGCEDRQGSVAPPEQPTVDTQPPSNPAEANADSAASTIDSAAAPHDENSRPSVTVEVIAAADFPTLLDAHRGKWVLVDFWGTWCVPCRELLPHTVDAGKRLADKDLIVIPIAIDDAEQKDEIARVLSQSGYAGKAYCVREGISMESFEKLEIAGGALPHLRLYDPQGKLTASFGVDALPPTAESIDAELAKQIGR